MRPTLCHPTDYAATVRRFKALTPESRGRWGRMSVEQMLCHVSDYLRLPFGEVPSPDRSTVLTRGVGWLLMRLPLSFPKNLRTLRELDQDREFSTKPAAFEADRDRLLAQLDRFAQTPETADWAPNTLFGTIGKQGWGRVGWIHLDHHLRQFGV